MHHPLIQQKFAHQSDLINNIQTDGYFTIYLDPEWHCHFSAFGILRKKELKTKDNLLKPVYYVLVISIEI